MMQHIDLYDRVTANQKEIKTEIAHHRRSHNTRNNPLKELEQLVIRLGQKITGEPLLGIHPALTIK